MGIYGALSTAVTGLRAQSFALENISGNIANSQTTGFKRIDTDFVDMIPDAAMKRQTAGSVLAQSRSTNNMQGDVKGVSTETNMAINGSGFFVVEPPIGRSDGDTKFSGANYYTRRGDFELDKNGYLVNGAGYYLKGLPIDPVTQNVSGSVPQVLRVSSSFLPAHGTTRVNYELNLPQLPLTPKYTQAQTAGSELLNADDFASAVPDTPAAATGTATALANPISDLVSAGQSITIKVGAAPAQTITFDNTGSTAGNNIDPAVTTTVGGMITALNNAFGGALTFTLNGAGQLTATAGSAANSIQVTANTTTGSTGDGLGFQVATTGPTSSPAVRVPTISANDEATFNAQSISGGAITVYAGNGAPANVQMRWAKVNSTATGGADRWNLYVLSDSSATGSATKWTKYGGDFTFNGDGSPNPPIGHTDLTGLTVNGVALGNIRLEHGSGGLTQFADTTGKAEVTTLSQNGYAAGEFVSVAVNDSGRVVVSYNNGQQLEVAQVVTANFNAMNQLKRMDGGVFAATSESGEPIFDEGGVMGSSLEASNTDISEEFTKLIVTQQAYAAGTRIVSTADQMLQEALNMVR